MFARNSFRPQAGRLFRRHSSTAPFNGVHALRFEISQEEAIVRLAPFASPMLAFRQFLGSFAARLLPGFGFEPIRPAQIIPVYFPAWVLDAELRASVTCNNIQRTVSIQLLNSYLPGNDLDVMSPLSFWDQDQPCEVVRFTSELEKQHGMQIQRLPYSISPFSVLDITKYWPHGDVEIADGLHISPTSITPTLMAAYPVLIPLYYAHYHVDVPALGTYINLTMVMEASSKEGRIFAYRYGQDLLERMPNVPASLLRPFEPELPSEPVYGDFVPFVRIPDVTQAPGIKDLVRWLEKKLQMSESLYPLLAQLSRDAPALQGKDQRVRDFLDEEDQTKIRRCLTLGSDISLLKMCVEASESGYRHPKVTEAMRHRSLQEKIDEFEKLKRESIPLWWEEWKRREHGTAECASQKQNS